MSWRAETRRRVEESQRVRSIAAAAVLRAVRDCLGVPLSWAEAEDLARRGDTEHALREVEARLADARRQVLATTGPGGAPVPPVSPPSMPPAPEPAPQTAAAGSRRDSTLSEAYRMLGRVSSVVDDLLCELGASPSEDVQAVARDAGVLRRRQRDLLRARIPDPARFADAAQKLDDVYERHLEILAHGGTHRAAPA